MGNVSIYSRCANESIIVYGGIGRRAMHFIGNEGIDNYHWTNENFVTGYVRVFVGDNCSAIFINACMFLGGFRNLEISSRLRTSLGIHRYFAWMNRVHDRTTDTKFLRVALRRVHRKDACSSKKVGSHPGGENITKSSRREIRWW